MCIFILAHGGILLIPKISEYKERWQIKSEDSIKPGLESIQKALQLIENPEGKLKVIHVAGTNGKGSTISFMESVLKEHGYTTGVFSSPAIIDIHDQIRIDGVPISENDLNQSFKRMKEAGLNGLLTDFELLTVAAFVTFERVRPDYVLLETGMGGLLDSTNVVTPIVSAITSIAVDHTAFLGETVNQVAEHKAGIIKAGIPVVTGRLPKEALQVVKRVAKEKQSILKVYGEQSFHGEVAFNIEERRMKGEHQRVNALVAIEALLVAGVPLNKEDVKQGVATTQLALRFDEISPGVFFDGAHNPAAARSLAETIRFEFPGEKVNFIIGMLKGKDIKGTLDELIPVAESFTFLTFPHPNAASAEELLDNCEHKNKSVTKVKIDTIILCGGEKGRIIVTGSLYLLASAIQR